MRPLFPVLSIFGALIPMESFANSASARQGQLVAAAAVPTTTVAAAAAPVATPAPATAPAAAASVSRIAAAPESEAPTVGMGFGFGFIPQPAARFELDLLFNSPQIFTVAFEAATFSNKHFVAKSLLVENYERDEKRRRMSLSYRNMFGNSMYWSIGLGFENYVANMLGPVTEYSKQYKTIIAGVRQGYTFTGGLGQSFKKGGFGVRIEWIGLSWLRKSKDVTFFDVDSESTQDKIAETKKKLTGESGESIRMMNTTLSYEF